MKYVYYPGCSLKGTSTAYEESLLAVFEALDTPLPELTGWNCCGATAYMSIDETRAFALAARNLALAEALENGEDVHIVAPCSACYLVLLKAQKSMAEHPELGQSIGDALEQVGLRYRGRVKVRHPLDVLVNDIGIDKITARVRRPLEGVTVACYYGCQVVRPYAAFDDAADPQTMDMLMTALGAKTLQWPLKARCCGGSLTGTVEEAGLRLSYIVLREAKKRGADVVATACPLCQFNLECYQDRMEHSFGGAADLPVAFFTQLIGAALGLDRRRLGLHRLLVQPGAALAGA